MASLSKMDDLPFRISKLPQKVIKRVLPQFEPLDLVTFALLSKNACNISKAFAPRKEKAKTLHIGTDYVMVKNEKDRRIFGCQISSDLEENGIFFKDIYEGTMKVAEVMKKFYDLPTIFSMDIQYPVERNFMDWAVKQTCTTVAIEGEVKISDMDLQLILTDGQFAQSLVIQPQTNPEFKNDFRIETRHHFSITHGGFITLDHLLTMSCRSMALGNSNLSNEDLNAILKAWERGGLTNMKKMIVTPKEPMDFGTIVDGTQAERKKLPIATEYLFKYWEGNEEGITFNESYQFKRQDQTCASLIISTPGSGIDQTSFQFVVWPDSQGRKYGALPLEVLEDSDNWTTDSSNSDEDDEEDYDRLADFDLEDSDSDSD